MTYGRQPIPGEPPAWSPILPASQLTQDLTGASFERDPAGAYFPTPAFST